MFHEDHLRGGVYRDILQGDFFALHDRKNHPTSPIRQNHAISHHDIGRGLKKSRFA